MKFPLLRSPIQFAALPRQKPLPQAACFLFFPPVQPAFCIGWFLWRRMISWSFFIFYNMSLIRGYRIRIRMSSIFLQFVKNALSEKAHCQRGHLAHRM